jgi:hypothetical protein
MVMHAVVPAVYDSSAGDDARDLDQQADDRCLHHASSMFGNDWVDRSRRSALGAQCAGLIVSGYSRRCQPR